VTTISIFRISFIWVETVPAILAKGVPPSAPYAFLGQYGGYAKEFNACQAAMLPPSRPSASGLKLPWNNPEGNFFWKYYFEGTHAGDVKGADAWGKIVPFQLELPCMTVTPDAEARVTFDSFYAPHGVAVIATANYREKCGKKPKSALDIAKLALAIRYDYRFRFDASDPAAGINLEKAAERALGLARQQGLGNVPGISKDARPFSVTTFLKGKDVDPIAQGSDEHFLLETVTTWNRYLKTADLASAPLADAPLKIRNADGENMMYARGRGRAIWFPREFVGNNRPMLACYHRNITHASLQTQSLGEFVAWVADQHAASRPLAGTVDDRARRAAALLELFSNGKVIYRTQSARAQIEFAKWAEAIAFAKKLP
jgi:hypothetical protein